MSFVRRALAWCGRFCCAFGWWFIGIWSALAIYFTGPGRWTPIALAIAVVWLFWSARYERFRLWRWFQIAWGNKWRTTCALAAATAIAVYFFGFDNADGLAAGAALGQYVLNSQLQPVPEPATWALYGLGLLTIVGLRRERGPARQRCLRP